VVSPVEESSLSSSARTVGFAADRAERRKAVHYANNCASQGIHIVQLAQETLCGWSIQAEKILSLLADRIADHKGLQRATCRSALFRELGIAIQRSIVCDIIERSGRLLSMSQRAEYLVMPGLAPLLCSSFCFAFVSTLS
jgi:hypothetical protein